MRQILRNPQSRCCQQKLRETKGEGPSKDTGRVAGGGMTRSMIEITPAAVHSMNYKIIIIPRFQVVADDNKGSIASIYRA